MGHGGVWPEDWKFVLGLADMRQDKVCPSHHMRRSKGGCSAKAKNLDQDSADESTECDKEDTLLCTFTLRTWRTHI